MRIVNREQFLQLPEGVVYQEYQPCIVEGLKVKGKNTASGPNWYYTDLIDNVKCNDSGERADILFTAQEKGEFFEMDHFCEERDGSYGEERLFVVYEKEDIQRFMYFIISTYNAYPKLDFKPKKRKR